MPFHTTRPSEKPFGRFQTAFPPLRILNVYPQITTDFGPAEWRNESTQKPPKQAVSLHDAGAAAILDQARQDTAVI